MYILKDKILSFDEFLVLGVSGGPGLFAFAGQPASGTFPSSSSSLVLGPPGMSIAGIGGGFAGVDRVDCKFVLMFSKPINYSVCLDIEEN